MQKTKIDWADMTWNPVRGRAHTGISMGGVEMDDKVKEIKPCEQCKHCRFPRSSCDNGGSCKCKIAKYKTIDVYVGGGETPSWCPLFKKGQQEARKC